jgi:hypothetical protein
MIAAMAKSEMLFGPDPEEADAFSDEHGTPSQRYFNALCLAYGLDKAQYADLIDESGMPLERVNNCENEYRQVAAAFKATMLPNIDAGLMEKVQSVPWLLTRFE